MEMREVTLICREGYEVAFLDPYMVLPLNLNFSGGVTLSGALEEAASTGRFRVDNWTCSRRDKSGKVLTTYSFLADVVEITPIEDSTCLFPIADVIFGKIRAPAAVKPVKIDLYFARFEHLQEHTTQVFSEDLKRWIADKKE